MSTKCGAAIKIHQKIHVLRNVHYEMKTDDYYRTNWSVLFRSIFHVFFFNIFKYIYFSGLTHSNFECRTLEKHWMNTNLIMKQKASDVFQRKKKVKWIARNSSSWKKQIMMMGKQIWWLFQCFHIELFALRKNNISRLKWQVNTSINLFCLLWRPYIFLKSYGWPETILFIRMFEIRSKVKV